MRSFRCISPRYIASELFLLKTFFLVSVWALLHAQTREGVIQISPNVRLFCQIWLSPKVHRRLTFRQPAGPKMTINDSFIITPSPQKLIVKPTGPPIRTVMIVPSLRFENFALLDVNVMGNLSDASLSCRPLYFHTESCETSLGTDPHIRMCVCREDMCIRSRTRGIGCGVCLARLLSRMFLYMAVIRRVSRE
jgi:hypothetical protein